MRVLIAPSGFKESLDAPEVADAIAIGVACASPSATIRVAPIADGGEGFTRALVEATSGTLIPVIVTGPVGKMVPTAIGILGGDGPRTAVVEMAAAAGLRLVPRTLRNPQLTTSYGVGELIRAALDAGVERIVMGCGDSGTNDGGMGMAAALGVKFLGGDGQTPNPIGANLAKVATIITDELDPRLQMVNIEVACNIANLLCGPTGVARVFGPQKGATPEQVEVMAAGLDQYAATIEAATGLDVRTAPGSGASGGLGAALLAFLGVHLLPRWEVITRYFDLDELLDWADIVFTAEGSLDGQTPNGKIPAELGRRAQMRNQPVVALAGRIGAGASATKGCGISAYTSVVAGPCTLIEAIDSTALLLTNGAEQAMRMIMVGVDLRTH
jgi:glycerate 2-kinase